MNITAMTDRVGLAFVNRTAKQDVPEAFKKEWKNDDKDGDGKENEPKPDFLKDKEKKAGCEKLPEGPMRDNCEKKKKESADRMAGCEKLPAGGMRDNCEKKSKGGDGDKKDDGKKDDSKLPDFLKKKKESADRRAVNLLELEDVPEEVLDAIRRTSLHVSDGKYWIGSSGNIMADFDSGVLSKSDLAHLIRAGLSALMGGSSLSISFKV